jgi:hypothetical protein
MNKVGSWYKVQYIYKDVEINLSEDMEAYQRDQELSKLDEAPDVVINKWILSTDVYSVEEATTKSKERFLRDDIYVVYISGDAPINCIIKDIEKFLLATGPIRD